MTVLVRLPNHVGDACMALPGRHRLRGLVRPNSFGPSGASPIEDEVVAAVHAALRSP